MLDANFCELLEYELTKSFAYTTNETAKHFWCDGILLPTFNEEYSIEAVKRNKQIILTAYIGSSGQDKYELTLKFGNKALSYYEKKLDLCECVPHSETFHFFDIDIEKMKITVKLD